MKTKKKICYKCKKEIQPCVCDFFITHWNEEDEEYECSQCWNSRAEENYQKELHARKILQEILSRRLKQNE
jgi:hypothetical protein